MTVDQAVDDVRHDRFPVTFDEATVLVAIRAQALLGDCDCDCDSDGAAGSGVGSGMYASILKTTLPVDISKSLNRAEIVSSWAAVPLPSGPNGGPRCVQ